MKNKCKHFQANFDSNQTLRCIIRQDKIEGLLKEVLKILFLNYSAAFDKEKRNNVVAHWEQFVTQLINAEFNESELQLPYQSVQTQSITKTKIHD